MVPKGLEVLGTRDPLLQSSSSWLEIYTLHEDNWSMFHVAMELVSGIQGVLCIGLVRIRTDWLFYSKWQMWRQNPILMSS